MAIGRSYSRPRERPPEAHARSGSATWKVRRGSSPRRRCPFRELLREHRTVVRAAFAALGRRGGGDGRRQLLRRRSPRPPRRRRRPETCRSRSSPARSGRASAFTPALALAEERGYVGLDVHRAARIAGVAHGGQIVLVGRSTAHVSGDIVDLGEHRLKDLSAPVRLFQVGESRFPPLRSLHRTNLPGAATSFVGREDALGRSWAARDARTCAS